MAVILLGLAGTLPAMRMLDVHSYRLNRDTSPICRRHERRARVPLLMPMRCFMLCAWTGTNREKAKMFKATGQWEKNYSEGKMDHSQKVCRHGRGAEVRGW